MTRDTDVGAKSEICRLLNALAAEGPAMAVISFELPEVLRLSRRTAVMCEGHLRAAASMMLVYAKSSGGILNGDDAPICATA